MNAEISEKEAKARKTLAEAIKSETGRAGDQIANLRAAMEAAIQIAGAPAVAAAADRVLETARSEALRDPQAEAAQAQAQQAQEQAMMAEQAAAMQAQAMGAAPQPDQALPATEGIMA